MADKTPEYGTRPAEGIASHAKHPTFKIGAEVQFKKNPGFGYTVAAVVKNEHALCALDRSSMVIGLFHELEEYCDLEKASFIKKASAVIWEADAATVHLSHSDADKAREALKEVTERLFDAGARFPENLDVQTATFKDWSAQQILDGVVAITRKLVPMAYKDLSEQGLVESWANGHVPIQSCFINAMSIFDALSGLDSREAVLVLYPAHDYI